MNLNKKIKTFFLYFKKHYSDQDNKRLFENFISLSVLQGLNYILPLITLPYLVRVIGVEKFGLLSFATATIGYFQILTDYGFNLSATREISINRDDKEKVQDIFSAVITIKIIFLFVSFILLTILIFSINKFKEDWLVYYLTFGIVVGNVLFPVWLFQGIERMKYITLLNIMAKGVFTIAIFIFVKDHKDYLKVPLLNSSGFIIAGVVSLWVIYKKFNYYIRFPYKSVIVNQLKEGWYIFVSTIAISLYTISTTFILGLFTNNVYVGYYSAADKIIQALKGLMGPVSQSVYPFITKRVSESKERGLKFIRKVLIVVAVSTAFISIATFFLAHEIVMIVLGVNYYNSIIVLKILAFLPLIIGLSNVFGIQTMLPFNKKKAFQNILICASVFNIILSIILVPIYQHIGSAISVTIVEIFVTVAMFVYLQKTNIKLLSSNYV